MTPHIKLKVMPFKTQDESVGQCSYCGKDLDRTKGNERVSLRNNLLHYIIHKLCYNKLIKILC